MIKESSAFVLLIIGNRLIINLFSHLAHFDCLTQNVSAPNSQGTIMPAVLDLLFLRHFRGYLYKLKAYLPCSSQPSLFTIGIKNLHTVYRLLLFGRRRCHIVRPKGDIQ